MVARGVTSLHLAIIHTIFSQGDSGSSMTIERNGSTIILGVVSWGLG